MILDDIVAQKKKQIENEKKLITVEQLNLDCCDYNIRNFKKALQKEDISIIAEIKKASPSKGIIKEDFDPIKIAKIYEKLNIGAISVLTEKYFFMGNDSYIKEVRKVNSKPILRKDFIVDEYQIFQSKALLADAILLIVSVLGANLKRFYDLAKKVGLHCLVEVHNREELELALDAGCDVIGINNRDLTNFTVNLKTTESLIKYIPKDIVVVSESGIKTSEDIKYLRSLCVNAVLIGETFMKNIDDLDKASDFILKSKISN